jgi:hypothetical protein
LRISYGYCGDAFCERLFAATYFEKSERAAASVQKAEILER